MGSGEVRYGRDGTEKGARLEDSGMGCACWLSPKPDFSVFCPFPKSIRSSSADDSSTNEISAWEDWEFGSVSMGVSPIGWELGTWSVGDSAAAVDR